MRIGIIGSGRVGSALARGWAARGYDVVLGTAQPAPSGIRAEPVAAVLGTAEIIVLAVPYQAVATILAGATRLSGRTIIDCTNPVLPDASGLALGFDTSGAERIAGLAPGASVFKTLNQIGAEHMAAPNFSGPPPLMLVAGDDAARKPMVLDLVRALGFEAIDAGGLRMARLLEPLGMLWINLALTQGLGRDIGFALLRP